MKPYPFLLALLALLCLPLPSQADEVRPFGDGAGYCGTAEDMDRFVGFLEKHAPKPPEDVPALVAGISPHDEYLRTGRVYYPLFQRFSAPEVVVFGVTHRKIREKLGQPEEKLIFDTHARWQGPYGPIQVSGLREHLRKSLDTRHVLVSDEAHRMEHSIEALLPFLQHYRRDVRITPIMVTAMPFDTMEALAKDVAEAIDAYMKENRLALGKDVFLLISSDSNHYGKDFNNLAFGEGEAAFRQGIAHDREIAETYLAGPISPEKLRGLTARLWGKDFRTQGDTVWCGKYSIPFGLLTVHHLVAARSPDGRLTGRLLVYGDTQTEGVLPVEGTALRPTTPSSLEHWVGFLSAGYYLDESPGGR
ncbi:MAG: AmmeMemoRadiSam system protein B [Phycisphaerae bacterium]|nr:AmmeMemoRadiSam system protein B [Phycisphaerae bacterium]